MLNDAVEELSAKRKDEYIPKSVANQGIEFCCHLLACAILCGSIAKAKVERAKIKKCTSTFGNAANDETRCWEL